MPTDPLIDTNLEFGWIWAFSKQPSLEKKISESVGSFTRRFMRQPDVGFLNSADEIPEDFSCEFLLLRSRYVLPGTILLGISGDRILSQIQTSSNKCLEENSGLSVS